MQSLKDTKFFYFFGILTLSLLCLNQWLGRISNAADRTSTAQTHADASPHSANLQSFGQYHAEARTDKAGNVQLHIYGLQPGELMPLENNSVVEAAMVVPGEDAQPITFQPCPYPGEPQGKTSRWVGKWNPAGKGLSSGEEAGMNLTLQHDGHTYRVQWRPNNLVAGAVADAHLDPTMPAAASDSEAARLFQTPAGLYTASDIIANGNTTAALKYRGQMARHNMNPKPGDRLCPITNTAADKRFSWIVGGKVYRFCCPPCIEEFVKQAKEKPEAIREPDTYIKH